MNVTSIDAVARAGLLRLLRGLQARTGVAFVLIAHDLAVVKAAAHRVAVMHAGRLVELGDTADIFAAPARADQATARGLSLPASAVRLANAACSPIRRNTSCHLTFRAQQVRPPLDPPAAGSDSPAAHPLSPASCGARGGSVSRHLTKEVTYHAHEIGERARQCDDTQNPARCSRLGCPYHDG